MPPVFLPFNLTLYSLPHTQQVQPTLSPSIAPSPFPICALLAQHALSLLSSHFELYCLLPSLRQRLSLPFPITIAAYLAKVI